MTLPDWANSVHISFDDSHVTKPWRCVLQACVRGCGRQPPEYPERRAMIRGAALRTTSRSAPVALHAFLFRSLKDQWLDYRKEFARCRRKFSEKSVHQFRIDSRRLLSTMSVLLAVTPGRPLEAANRALKKRLRIFARLRDAHVQSLAIKELAREFPQLAAFRRYLAKRERRLERRVARKLKRTGLRGVATPVAAIRKELRRLREDRDQEQKNFRSVLATLKAGFKSVTARFRAIDPSKPLTIHRTRIAFKKFRYMIEALQPILTGVTSRVLGRMRDYQARMGEIQDASVLRSSFQSYLVKHRDRVPDAARIRSELERRERALIAAFLAGADELFAFAPSHHQTPVQERRLGPKDKSR